MEMGDLLGDDDGGRSPEADSEVDACRRFQECTGLLFKRDQIDAAARYVIENST